MGARRCGELPQADDPVAANAKFVVTAKAGAGVIAAQLYSKGTEASLRLAPGLTRTAGPLTPFHVFVAGACSGTLWH